MIVTSNSILSEIISKVGFLAFTETERGAHKTALDLILGEISSFEHIFTH